MRKIICIGRQSGTNGRVIARKTAEKLGIPCYDEELLQKAVEESGISEDVLKKADERAANPLLYTSLYEGSNKEFFGKNANDILFLAQTKVIQALAEKEDCIFVGRCADNVLRRAPCSVLSVFITAPMRYRIRTVMERENTDEKGAAAHIRKVDRWRKVYYDYYTGNDWGKPSDYDVVLNAGLLGEDRVVDILVGLYAGMEGK